MQQSKSSIYIGLNNTKYIKFLNHFDVLYFHSTTQTSANLQSIENIVNITHQIVYNKQDEIISLIKVPIRKY